MIAHRAREDYASFAHCLRVTYKFGFQKGNMMIQESNF